jgi:probable HAF family extracellular repeat protein
MKKQVINWLTIFSISSFSFAATPSFQGLGDLPGNSFFSVATDISGDGTVVVGYSDSISGSSQVFRWTAETGMIGLEDFIGSYPTGSPPKISRDGSTIVGSVQNEAARWTSQRGLERLGVLETPSDFKYASIGTGVSADGSVVVGYCTNYLGDAEAFKWTPQTSMIGLGSPLPGSRAFAVSDSGSVTVGTAYYVGQDGLEGEIAARWTEDGMTYFDPKPDFIVCDATDTSADGSVIVGSGGIYDLEAYRWTQASGIVPLGYIHGTGYSSFASSISGDGTIIVGECDREAFVWDEENGMRSIKEILVADYGLNLSGWSLTAANAISYDGMTIVGYGTNPNGNLEAWVATIPEPCTILLLGLGGLLIRRK